MATRFFEYTNHLHVAVREEFEDNEGVVSTAIADRGYPFEVGWRGSGWRLYGYLTESMGVDYSGWHDLCVCLRPALRISKNRRRILTAIIGISSLPNKLYMLVKWQSKVVVTVVKWQSKVVVTVVKWQSKVVVIVVPFILHFC